MRFQMPPLVLVFCLAMLSAAAAQDKSQDMPSVIVAPVAERDVTPQSRHIARVEAMDTVELRARVEGFLEERSFREGTEIKAGDLLFVIEKAPYEVVVQQRQADLAQAQATRKNAEADFKRKAALVKRKAVSAASLDESRANLESARASVLKAQASLRQAKLDLSYTEVRSPIPGQISSARYSVGNLVGPTSEPLATVARIDPIHVTISVSEKLLLRSARDGELDRDNPPVTPSLVLSDGSNYGHAGAFDYLAPTVDRNTGTVTARAVFPNPGRLLVPGQFVTMIVRDNVAVAKLAVPQSAVQQDASGHFVLVLAAGDKIEKRRVTLGPQVDNDWVVEKGLSEGELIVVQGIQKVRPDMRVKPIPQSGA